MKEFDAVIKQKNKSHNHILLYIFDLILFFDYNNYY